MDPITHAASGAVLALAFPRRPQTLWFAPVAGLISASPDLDVVLIQMPLDYILLHRGITHALVAIPFFGALCACASWPLWRKTTPGAWRLWQVWGLAMLLYALHIWLDCLTTYGTMIFQPFSDYRVRLNTLFIVDLALLAPLVVAVVGGGRCRALVLGAAVWLGVYPLLALGWHALVTHQTTARLQAAGTPVLSAYVLPDVFAPVFWRVIYLQDTPYTPTRDSVEGFNYVASPYTVCQQGLSWDGTPRTRVYAASAAPPEVIKALEYEIYAAQVFFDFSLLPVMQTRSAYDDRPSLLPLEHRPFRETRFFDLRFDSMLQPVRSFAVQWGWRGAPFQFWVLEHYNKIEGWYMRGGVQAEFLWYSAEADDIPDIPQTLVAEQNLRPIPVNKGLF